MDTNTPFAPRIYYLHPLLIGPVPAWDAHFEHAARMGFNHVLSAPVFLPGRDGDLFVAADFGRPHPLFHSTSAVTELLSILSERARAHGLSFLLDAPLTRVSAEAPLLAKHGNWFHPPACENGLLDPRHAPAEAWIAQTNFSDPETLSQWTEWSAARLGEWADAGVAGFRFDAPAGVPAHVWRHMAAALRARHPQARFLAWTPGLDRTALTSLEGAGIDAVFSSLRWWDYRADWLLEEYAALTRVAPPLAFPESPFEARLASEYGAAPNAVIERAYRRALRAAAFLGSGLLVPMGFEYGSSVPLSRRAGSVEDFETARAAARFNLVDELTQINALIDQHPVLAVAGDLRRLSAPGADALALLRTDARDARQAERAALLVINADLERPAPVRAARLFDGVPGEFTHFANIDTALDANDAVAAPMSAGRLPAFTLAPGAVRGFDAARAAPVLNGAAARGAKTTKAAQASDRKAAAAAAAAPRIAIEHVTPCVDAGRFPVKRVVGERVRVEADILMDGHDKLGARVRWRTAERQAGENDWQTTAMTPLGNDRWGAHVPLERLGPYEFIVEAWLDSYGSLLDHIEKKVKAHQDIALEIEEARRLIEKTAASGAPAVDKISGDADAPSAPLSTLLQDLTMAAGTTARIELLTAPATVRALAAAGAHACAVSSAPLRILAERASARFASWYELFPRSQSGDPTRHGTFIDVIARLPALQEMGFDVLYFPPIHPIGRSNRKGRNNTLQAAPEDVGSPYAIGAAEGGHTALHPELGNYDDFRTLLEAAHAHGMEIALDFAIQCSPDHPWLAEHPGWFAWRPDGSLRYAENPPKKYQDIVNPDFYADEALPDLWLALRDVVLFWIDAGVRIFRVDNPHTKPLPFWEWMIGDVMRRHPDTIFLSEAFTRPKVMKRLAKLGFSQSYTYFTWRESKQDFIEYLTELTQTDARDYLRPNFFVNTPDINPRFLQASGRAGFVIRAALAALLSGLWGIYSGFELCEAAALPDSEEYLDSEKYQLRARDWRLPGNIIGEIALLNRIRQANPALHTHLGVSFLPAHNERILLFEKATPSRDNVLLIAICLDPFTPQQAAIELPLWKWGLADHDAVLAEDLVGGSQFEMRGVHHSIRLDPGSLPFLIRRVRPLSGSFRAVADADNVIDTGNVE